MLRTLRFILRCLFALMLFATSIGKLLDNRGFMDVILSYQLPGFENTTYVLLFALMFSLFEFFLALILIKDLYPIKGAWLLMFLQFGYVCLAGLTIYRDIYLENCGCFGVFFKRPLTMMTIYEDLVLLILAVIYFMSTRKLKLKPKLYF